MLKPTAFTYILISFSLLFTLINCLGKDDLTMTYKQFKTKFQKAYLAPQQQSQREKIFLANIQILRNKIAGGCDACGVTKFFDQTFQQVRGRLGLLPQQQANQPHPDAPKTASTLQQIISNDNLIKVGDAPTSKNWADQGKITSIKNQGSCGTCWSFATAAAIQSSLILQGRANNLFFFEPDLSQQFLLTCARTGDCKGGYLQQTIDLAYSKGVPYQSDYPYQGRKGDQSICSNTRGNVKFTDGGRARNSYYNVGDNQIINLLQQGPLMIALSADDWQYYGGGTFSCNATAQVNHAVLLVGYDQNRWIIKNQWGANWGQKGYIYVTRNRARNCQIGVAVHQLWSPILFYSLLITLLTFFLLI